VADGVDGVLAAIDSAVEDWDVSADAMRSAPDLPQRPVVTKLEIPLDWPGDLLALYDRIMGSGS
jgi:hypothetical protein